MKNRSFSAQLLSGLLLAAVTLAMTACGDVLYKDTSYNYSGRPTPPSNLFQRVLAAYSSNGSSGGLEILDGLRDLRRNVQNTIPTYSISGYAAGQPNQIISFPEELRGYVVSGSDGSVAAINYGTEAGSGTVATFGSNPSSVAASPDGTRFAGATNTGQLVVTYGGGTYSFSLPNVYKVAINQGNTVILAMVRNSNTLYRVVKLPATPNPVLPPGYVDCEPILLPIFCVVPVANTNSAGVPGAAYDHPVNASFSLDGTTVYIENCGPECGGTTAGLTFLQEGALQIDNVPTVSPLAVGAPSPLAALPVANPIPIPGGVTAVLSNGTTLYVSGQQLLPDGNFTGFLTTLNLSTYAVSAPISISDGNHSKMIFADDNTLWIGAQQCASGERAALATKQLAVAGGVTTQAANYNCLTLVSLASGTPVAQVVPAVTQVSSVGTSATAPVAVPYPNENLNNYYYGSLTGICWIQGFGKVYTAYGGQIHAFYTGGTIGNLDDPAYGTTPAPGAEANNINVTVQGTVLDVAYMDALTNSAN